MKETILRVQSSIGVETLHRHFHAEPHRKRLMIILPGHWYSCDAPALYYLRAMALDTGWDVISTEFGFQVARTNPDVPATMSELRLLLEQVAHLGYEEVCVAAKSAGTYLASDLLHEIDVPRSSLILLTPVEKALASPSGVPTLSVIGTLDPVYGKPAYHTARGRGDHDWLVLDGVNHGPNRPDDWLGSAQVITQVVEACQRFLSRL